MPLIKIDPFRSIDNAQRVMRSFFNDLERHPINMEYGSFSPRIDITEDEKNLYLQAELPGLKKEDVKITVNNENILTIKGEKKWEFKKENDQPDCCFIRQERIYGSFTRSFSLPDNIKNDSISAKFENGVLHLTFDKVEPAKPKEFEVNIA